MQLRDGRHFSYCMNVHPGEELADVISALRSEVPEIKNALCPEKPFGLGLRIAHQASLELFDAQHRPLQLLGEGIASQNAYGFTINGFPYGAFHHTRVKEQVYQPDWSFPERRDYSKDLFSLLAHSLLPEGMEGSVSTVPLGYKYTRPAPDKSRMLQHLADLARHLHELEQETGKLLHLGLEPEPDCILETTAEAIAFFEEELLRSQLLSEDILRRHLGICLDTCHVAMQFEDPAESVRQLVRAGIRISKTQISAALECDAKIDPARLQAFDDGVYLHQVKSAEGKSWRDLPDFLNHPETDAGTLRIHAHVPLHWEGDGELQSTRHSLTPAFWKALTVSGCPHLEVETYTFDVLPEDLRAGRSVAEDMIEECKWALGVVEEG